MEAAGGVILAREALAFGEGGRRADADSAIATRSS